MRLGDRERRDDLLNVMDEAFVSELVSKLIRHVERCNVQSTVTHQGKAISFMLT